MLLPARLSESFRDSIVLLDVHVSPDDSQQHIRDTILSNADNFKRINSALRVLQDDLSSVQSQIGSPSAAGNPAFRA